MILAPSARGLEIDSNAVHMARAPSWLRRPRVDRIVDRIQTKLEWTIRRTEVFWYNDAAKFEAEHRLGPFAMSVTRGRDLTVHLGPKVTDANFDVTFAHELVHLILRQKYKDAVPKWLEEGLACHLAKGPPVDYAWLARRPFPKSVRELTHPYRVASAEAIHYHYVASQALLEMIAKKCDFAELLRLSVGVGMEGYLRTYCEITDLDEAFHKWVVRQGKG